MERLGFVAFFVLGVAFFNMIFGNRATLALLVIVFLSIVYANIDILKTKIGGVFK